jgi:tetratricopeptide (TPR) repeat protein
MSLRYRRSISLGKGIRINFGKKGIGFSVGRKGARIGIGSHGAYTSFGIPGTGLYSINYLNKNKRRKSSPKNIKTVDTIETNTISCPPELLKQASQEKCLYLLFGLSFLFMFIFLPVAIVGFVVSGILYYKVAKTPISKALSYFKFGNKALKKDDYQKALDNFLKVIEIQPDTYSLYKEIGFLSEKLGKDNEAIGYFKKYLMQCPNDIQIKEQYANLLIKTEQYQNALNTIEELPSEHKNNLSVINAIAYCYLKLNKPDMALVALENGPIRKRKTDNELMKMFRYLLGLTYIQLNQNEKALKQIEKVYIEDNDFLDVSEMLKKLKDKMS